VRVVVTGADGLIGRFATRAFVEQGWTTVGVGLGPRPEGSAAHEWITADLSEDGVNSEAFAGADAVIHLAAIPGRLTDDRTVFRNNVCATFNTLDAAGVAGVPRVVLASSISIYGIVWSDRDLTPPEIPLRETTPLLTTESYSLSKEVDEATARMMSRRYGTSIAALRFPLVAEESDILERSQQVRRDSSVGHRELWAYLTLADAARALVLAAIADFQGVVVANIVSPQSLGGIDAVSAGASTYPDSTVGARTGNGYTTDVARDVFGFVGSSIVPSE
jgi:nucleoside-diphosphate-sugar epimerase